MWGRYGEEHPADDHLGLVALERVASEHHLLKDDAVGVSGE